MEVRSEAESKPNQRVSMSHIVRYRQRRMTGETQEYESLGKLSVHWHSLLDQRQSKAAFSSSSSSSIDPSHSQSQSSLPDQSSLNAVVTDSGSTRLSVTDGHVPQSDGTVSNDDK